MLRPAAYNAEHLHLDIAPDPAMYSHSGAAPPLEAVLSPPLADCTPPPIPRHLFVLEGLDGSLEGAEGALSPFTNRPETRDLVYGFGLGLRGRGSGLGPCLVLALRRRAWRLAGVWCRVCGVERRV